ncbi:MAG: N-acetyltransferase family protein [Nostocoides sp.]
MTATGGLVIRDGTPADNDACLAIYNEAVRNLLATFDTVERGPEHFDGRLGLADPRSPFLVAEIAGAVAGYAHAYPYRPRAAYDATREVSVYLADSARGQGIGRMLYAALLARLDAAGCHTQVAVIALPNEASEALHRAFGFEHVGTLREVGHKFGRWVDTAWHQRMSPPAS